MQYNKKPDILRGYRAASSEFIFQLRKLADRRNSALQKNKNFLSLHLEQVERMITAFADFYDCAGSLADELSLTRHAYNTSCLNQRLQSKAFFAYNELEKLRKEVVNKEASFDDFEEKLNEFVR